MSGWGVARAQAIAPVATKAPLQRSGVRRLPADCQDYADQPTTDENLASTMADRGVRYGGLQCCNGESRKHTGGANGERKTEWTPARHKGNRYRANRDR